MVSTLVLIVGTLVRSLPGPVASLWIGTILLGAAIAVANVVVPAIVKHDFPSDVPLVTGLYSAVLGGTAAVASGLALPISDLGGWRLGIGVWGLLSVVAAVVWPLRSRGRPASEPPVEHALNGTRSRSVWRSAVAWQVSLVMATQALTFYLLVTWLPTIEVSFGVDPVTAGWYSFLYQIVGIAAGLAVTVFMRGRADHRAVGVVVSLLLMVAMAGLLIAPSWSVLWLVLAGLSAGSSLVAGAGPGRRAFAHCRRHRPVVRNGAERRLPAVCRGTFRCRSALRGDG